MTVKHMPATPLPWNGAHGVQTANHEMVALCSRRYKEKQIDAVSERCNKDAAYIAHAANAYPQLVEALRVEKQMLAAWFTITSLRRKMREEIRLRLGAINALLRELGEG